MINLSPMYVKELYDKACKRTVKMGAESINETIALLEHEINQCRDKIKKLEVVNKELSINKDMIKHFMNSYYGIYGDSRKTVITINRTDVASVDVYFKDNEKEGK